MKYQVMSSDGVQDFNKESDARVLFKSKKQEVDKEKVKIKDGIEIAPTVHIHKCYHDESDNRPCEIIEVYKKK